MKNKTREIVILHPNETSNLINLNLIRHVNSNLKVRAFEIEELFLAYLEDFRGTLFYVYVHERFSKDIKGLLSRIFSAQKDVQLFIINEGDHQVLSGLDVKGIHQNFLVEEIIQNLSY